MFKRRKTARNKNFMCASLLLACFFPGQFMGLCRETSPLSLYLHLTFSYLSLCLTLFFCVLRIFNFLFLSSSPFHLFPFHLVFIYAIEFFLSPFFSTNFVPSYPCYLSIQYTLTITGILCSPPISSFPTTQQRI